MGGPTPQTSWVFRGRVLCGPYPLLEGECLATLMTECGINHFVNLLEDHEIGSGRRGRFPHSYRSLAVDVNPDGQLFRGIDFLIVLTHFVSFPKSLLSFSCVSFSSH